jgi:hypothetical protein
VLVRKEAEGKGFGCVCVGGKGLIGVCVFCVARGGGEDLDGKWSGRSISFMCGASS